MSDPTLDFAWKLHLQAEARAGELQRRCDDLWSRIKKDKFHAEGNRTHSEGNTYRAEAVMVSAEGERVFADAVLAVRGDVSMKWLPGGDCIVEEELFKGLISS